MPYAAAMAEPLFPAVLSVAAAPATLPLPRDEADKLLRRVAVAVGACSDGLAPAAASTGALVSGLAILVIRLA